MQQWENQGRWLPWFATLCAVLVVLALVVALFVATPLLMKRYFERIADGVERGGTCKLLSVRRSAVEEVPLISDGGCISESEAASERACSELIEHGGVGRCVIPGSCRPGDGPPHKGRQTKLVGKKFLSTREGLIVQIDGDRVLDLTVSETFFLREDAERWLGIGWVFDCCIMDNEIIHVHWKNNNKCTQRVAERGFMGVCMCILILVFGGIFIAFLLEKK